MITEPGTIDDMVADAAAAGYPANVRLIRDWTQQGLLDSPRRRPAGKGHGSAAALYSASQRDLLLALLYHRPGKSISSLARIPVAIWMYWGDEYVPVHQAHRALRCHLGDPQSRAYSREATRASKDRAHATARAVLRQLDNPRATPAARRELLDVLTETAWTGRPDFGMLERAITAVFDAGSTQIRRATGHPAAPVTTEAMVTSVRARLAAVSALTAGQVTGEMLAQAPRRPPLQLRQVHSHAVRPCHRRAARRPAAVRAGHSGGHAGQLLREPAVDARAGDPLPAAGRADTGGPHASMAPPRGRRLWPHLPEAIAASRGQSE